jgi:DNA-binding transcriptional ArsR family regulator
MTKALKDTLWWVLAGTRGGRRRANIILTLKERPMNARQLQKVIGLDYKTIRYHLDLLTDNDLLTTIGNRYGLLYTISPTLDSEFDLFEDIWWKISQERNNNVIQKETNRIN